MRRLSTFMMLAFVAAACATGPRIGPGTTTVGTAPPTTAEPPSGRFVGLAAETVVAELGAVTDLVAVPGDDRIYAVLKEGRIVVVDGDGDVADEPFLDLRAEVGDDGAEQGMLGLAFHPRFPADPRIYVTFTDTAGDLHVVAMRADRDAVNRRTRQEILTVPQPHQYHQGGGIRFGPDGYLWISLGDGGGIGDEYGNGQDPSTLLGSIVRIDVDAASPYAIPPDNPFVDTPGFRPEVWAYGLRNPWRFTFDGEAGLVVIADVGQYAWEEVDVAGVDEGGANFGWPVMEGPECFDGADCDPTGLVAPTLALPHEGLCALIGGPVYQGAAIPELRGHYFYGDFCVGWVRSAPLRATGSFGPVRHWRSDLGELGNITTFGTDGAGEVLVANLEGTIYRLVAERSDG